MTSATPRPCSRGSSRVPLSLLTKLTTRIASAPISELKAPFPTSPTAPTAGGSPGGQRLFIASATMSNASSTSSSSTGEFDESEEGGAKLIVAGGNPALTADLVRRDPTVIAA